MGSDKFCFIACVFSESEDAQLANEISSLNIPDGYEIEYLGVQDVPSIAAGYNEAIDATDAQFKIFLRPGVHLQNPDILKEILRITSKDTDIAVIGVLGTDKMPLDMIIQHGIMYGKQADDTFPVDGNYHEVLCVTEDFFVVVGDYRFRDDLFDGEYFYNVGLCADVLKDRKKIVVANQDTPWISEVSSPVYSEDFEKYRRIALENYGEIFGIDRSAKRIGVTFLEEMSANDLLWPLLKTKHDVEIMDLGISIYRNTPEDVAMLCDFINTHHLDACISYDFCPAISDACENCGVKYISWIYDSPQQALYEGQVRNSCNYVFSFDKDQTEFVKASGCPQVYYQPLAANMDRFSQLQVTDDDKRAYGCDISFVGSLYSDNPYEEIAGNLGDDARSELESIISSAFGVWDGKDHIKGALSKASQDEILKAITSASNSMAEKDPETYINARLISRHLTNMERREILKKLSKFGIRFYTRDEDVAIDGVTVCPPLDYGSELPKAYALSRINLNITLHTITSGIPLRVFDIMGSGGFMLSNYQPEIEELFEIGKEIEIFRTIPELEEKVAFYLDHEDLRKAIAQRGFEKISKYHNYDVSMANILRKVGFN